VTPPQCTMCTVAAVLGFGGIVHCTALHCTALHSLWRQSQREMEEQPVPLDTGSMQPGRRAVRQGWVVQCCLLQCYAVQRSAVLCSAVQEAGVQATLPQQLGIRQLPGS
jgi:hypothetical protein